jgi:hypothetical protein
MTRSRAVVEATNEVVFYAGLLLALIVFLVSVGSRRL